jgi:hypothetical protein
VLTVGLQERLECGLAIKIAVVKFIRIPAPSETANERRCIIVVPTPWFAKLVIIFGTRFFDPAV